MSLSASLPPVVPSIPLRPSVEDPVVHPIRRAHPLISNDSNNDTHSNHASSISSQSHSSGLGASIKRQISNVRQRWSLALHAASTSSALVPLPNSSAQQARSDSFDLQQKLSRPRVFNVTALIGKASAPKLNKDRSKVRHARSRTETSAHHFTAATLFSPDFFAQMGIFHRSSDHAEGTLHSEHQQPSKLQHEVIVPESLRRGTSITKVTNKTQKQTLFRLDPDQGQIVWESKQQKFIPIESIKELRSGVHARLYREQFQLSAEYEERWLTIIYVLDCDYKSLHLVFQSKEQFQQWNTTLGQLHTIRQELMKGLGHRETREALWLKHYWSSADEHNGEQKLEFEEVLRLCRRLNINSGEEDLRGWFDQADSHNRGCLSFEDFTHFVKLLKARPEVKRLYKKLSAYNNNTFDYEVFKRFMRESQGSTHAEEELVSLFEKYSVPTGASAHPSPTSAPPSTPSHDPPSLSKRIFTVDTFTSFLMSADNPALLPQETSVWQDMSLPMSDYYVSSSHNTYLVGHQLVGESTVEGYIRALLRGCRSVEVDIYDGDEEPLITHGKTLTSSVSLREVCQAIAKYGFKASPYPIIISAEVHCSIPQQDIIARIMVEVFGDMLIRAPVEGRSVIEKLPSPRDLMGKIMLKTKNLYISSGHDADSEISTDTSASSASESDASVSVKKKKKVTDVFLTTKEPSMPKSFFQRVKSVSKRNKSASSSASASTTYVALAKAVIAPSTPTPPPVTGSEKSAPRSQASASTKKEEKRKSAQLSTKALALTEKGDLPGPLPVPILRLGGPPEPWIEDTLSLSTSPKSEDSFNFDSKSSPNSTSLVKVNGLKMSSISEVMIPDDYPTEESVEGMSLMGSTTTLVTSATPPTRTAHPPGPLKLSSDGLFPIQSPPSSVLPPTPATAASNFAVPSPNRPPKMSTLLLALLVYTVGVKCRGINKKEEYAPEHMFSLSESAANKMMRSSAGGFALEDSDEHSESEGKDSAGQIDDGGGQDGGSNTPVSNEDGFVMLDKKPSGSVHNGSSTVLLTTPTIPLDPVVRTASIRQPSLASGKKKTLNGKGGMMDLIKHNRTHLTRTYPKGLRVSSSNYEPHRFWASGCQLVAINWQTFDQGFILNHGMFQRNGRCGFVLKPLALRSKIKVPHMCQANPSSVTSPLYAPSTLSPASSIGNVPMSPKELLSKRTKHKLRVRVISAQQLPVMKDASGREVSERSSLDPFVEVSLHVPEWPIVQPSGSSTTVNQTDPSSGKKKLQKESKDEKAKRKSTVSVNTGGLVSGSGGGGIARAPSIRGGVTGSGAAAPYPTTSAKTTTQRTSTVKNNGFNPTWEDDLSFTFEVVGDMKELVFVKFAVKFGDKEDKDSAAAIYCASLGSLALGYRHLPLHDAQLSQYLYSTLFVLIEIEDI